MRILIADDHQLMLTGVRTVLEDDGGFEIVAETHRATELLAMVGSTRPEVVLLGTHMPGLDVLTWLDRLRTRHNDVHVVLLSPVADPREMQSAFKRGASGYIIKNIDPRDIGSAIRQSIDGTAYHARGLPFITNDTAANAVGLTKRELDIVRLLKTGLNNKPIAKELWVTEQTVKFHLTSIYSKLGVSNRTEATRWAFDNGLEDHQYEERSVHRP